MVKTHESIILNSLVLVMSRANEGMTAWLENPAMNGPKAIPRWF
jgi:hypothetical protein